MSHAAKTQVDAWVFHFPNGTITKVMFREPKGKDIPAADTGIEVFKTHLSEWSLNRVHQLRVMSGKVVHGPALVGL